MSHGDLAFAPCEKFKKTVRQLTDRAKRKPARLIDGCTWPLSYGRKAASPRLSFVPVKTFSYWHKKYKKENGLSVEENKETFDTFIPVKVSGGRTANVSDGEYGRIEVYFPNGVQMSCPVGIDIGQLKSMINF
jgi:hypothetical protein